MSLESIIIFINAGFGREGKGLISDAFFKAFGRPDPAENH